MVEFAERMGGIKASDIRQLLAVASKPEIISFAGGLPAPELFPVDDITQFWMRPVRLRFSMALPMDGRLSADRFQSGCWQRIMSQLTQVRSFLLPEASRVWTLSENCS